MKKYLSSSLLLISAFFHTQVYSQDVKQLDKKNGLEISYQLDKLKEDVKKDTYLITVFVKNSNDFDMFYQAPKNGVNPFYGGVSIRNAEEYVYLQGEKSRLNTELGSLFYIAKNDVKKFTKEFRAPKNTNLVVTSYFIDSQAPKQIADFR